MDQTRQFTKISAYNSAGSGNDTTSSVSNHYGGVPCAEGLFMPSAMLSNRSRPLSS